MKRESYATGHLGKWHLGTLTKTVAESNRGGPKGAKHFAPPWINGFDVGFSTEAKVPTWDPLLRPKGVGRNNWWDPVADASQAVQYGTNYWSDGKTITENLRGDDSRAIMDRAIPFVREQAKADKPFFAIIWFHAPHLPVVSGEKYTAPYAKFDKHTQHYYGCIAALDEQVGRLRKELRDAGVADNTMLWFCSDNGPEGNAKAPGSTNGLRGRKRSLFEGGVRVPAIVEWPARVKPATATDIPCVTSDYLPTILDAAGARMPDDRPMDGVSLLPLLDGEMKSRPKPIAFESGGQLALVDNRYKLIHANDGKQQKKNRAEDGKLNLMLFDLVTDPAEKTDVSDQHPDLVRRMTANLLEWRKSCERSRAGEDYR